MKIKETYETVIDLEESTLDTREELEENNADLVEVNQDREYVESIEVETVEIEDGVFRQTMTAVYDPVCEAKHTLETWETNQSDAPGVKEANGNVEVVE